MKWFLAATAALLLMAFTYCQLHATKTSYVNGLAEYNTFPGREFIFERDVYIFKLQDTPTQWPLIGAHLTVPQLPETVTEKNIQAKLPGVRILDVVRTGSRFKIVSVRRDENRRETTLTFELLFMDEAERKYPRVDAYWLLDHTSGSENRAPHILEMYAVERKKG